jgi:hypothetical protein
MDFASLVHSVFPEERVRSFTRARECDITVKHGRVLVNSELRQAMEKLKSRVGGLAESLRKTLNRRDTAFYGYLGSFCRYLLFSEKKSTTLVFLWNLA